MRLESSYVEKGVWSTDEQSGVCSGLFWTADGTVKRQHYKEGVFLPRKRAPVQHWLVRTNNRIRCPRLIASGQLE